MAWHQYTGPTGSHSFEGRSLVQGEVIDIPKTHEDFDPTLFTAIDPDEDSGR